MQAYQLLGESDREARDVSWVLSVSVVVVCLRPVFDQKSRRDGVMESELRAALD